MQVTLDLGNSVFAWNPRQELDANLFANEDPYCSFRQYLKIVTGEQLEITPSKYTKLAKNFVSASNLAPALMPKNLLKQNLQLTAMPVSILPNHSMQT